MLAQVQPAIPRLGIKAFTNFTEGLHGLGRVRGGSVTATTFPQAVGLGRPGTPRFFAKLGPSKGIEARVYVKSTRAPASASPSGHPMWTWPGTPLGPHRGVVREDPYFVGKFGRFIRASGRQPKYLPPASTMKHFLANSNEDGRTSSSSDFDERNLREYYLVPFQMGIQEANAQSFMAS